jgi:periplasmic nitrate reductase NapD
MSREPTSAPRTGHTADEPELHIAGVLVQARPAALAAVRHEVDRLDHAEIYQASPDGRVVVVLEGASPKQVLDQLDRLRAVPGVLNVSLAYQHAEPASAMQQEIHP